PEGNTSGVDGCVNPGFVEWRSRKKRLGSQHGAVAAVSQAAARGAGHSVAAPCRKCRHARGRTFGRLGGCPGRVQSRSPVVCLLALTTQRRLASRNSFSCRRHSFSSSLNSGTTRGVSADAQERRTFGIGSLTGCIRPIAG